MKARNIFLCLVVIAFSIFKMPVLLCNKPKGTESNFFIHTEENSIPNSEKKIGYIFAHGLGASQDQASLFMATSSEKWLINKPLVVFDFPDSKKKPMEYHSLHVNLGQERDISRLKEIHELAEYFLKGYRFIFAGISRGSAAILNYVAEHQPDSVAGIVVECPFDTLNSIIKHLLRRFHVNWVPFSRKIALKLAKNNFPSLNTKGIFPLNVIHKIKSDIPIMIVHSRKDRTIPVNSSRNLYKSLVCAGHNNVYFLELASGEHGKLVHSIESDLYANVLHAFYKKYNLPHDVQFALNGENMLKFCQPTVEEISKKIKKSKSTDDFLDPEFDGDFDDDFFRLEKNFSFELEVSPLSTAIHTLF